MKKPLSQKWFLKCSKTLRCEKLLRQFLNEQERLVRILKMRIQTRYAK